MQNRVFFPQGALDTWLSDGSVDLQGTELSILAEARRYRIAEALHVKSEVTGAPDANEIVGRVKSVAFLQELGAEIVESSMILGDNAYDVGPGWLGSPVGSFEEHVASPQRAEARVAHGSDALGAEPTTDEDLLTRSLMKNL